MTLQEIKSRNREFCRLVRGLESEGWVSRGCGSDMKTFFMRRYVRGAGYTKEYRMSIRWDGQAYRTEKSFAGIAYTLEEARERAGLTMQEAAQKLGIECAELAEYEGSVTPDHYPDVLLLGKIEDIYQIKYEKILF